ncbi:hypothetical protein, partial [Streptomyces ipomoeae]|uniref:hypothetical protein n=1 Tax=Streptomyces ipomoeae TaxID=103232 RepID=UPI001F4895B4
MFDNVDRWTGVWLWRLRRVKSCVVESTIVIDRTGSSILRRLPWVPARTMGARAGTRMKAADTTRAADTAKTAGVKKTADATRA